MYKAILYIYDAFRKTNVPLLQINNVSIELMENELKQELDEIQEFGSVVKTEIYKCDELLEIRANDIRGSKES